MATSKKTPVKLIIDYVNTKWFPENRWELYKEFLEEMLKILIIFNQVSCKEN